VPFRKNNNQSIKYIAKKKQEINKDAVALAKLKA
jgi:hypothetical protein